MSLRALFEADLEEFLATHAVSIKAAGSVALHLQGMDPFRGVKQKEDGVSLQTPTGFATLELKAPRKNHLVVKCGVPEVNLTLTDDTSAIPVYVVPYKGTSGLGVKLPAGPGVAYAITTQIDGCTFSVSGSPREPYAAHSNVYDLTAGPDEKSRRMADHIDTLNQKFRQAEAAAGGTGADVGQRPAHFNYWHRPTPASPASMVNYAQLAQQRARHSAQGTMHYRKSQFGRHKKYLVRVADRSTQEILDPGFIPYNAVIGRRENGVWQFFYNSATSVSFEVLQQTKMGSLKISSNQTEFRTPVVMTYGSLWPNREVKFRPFFTAVYEGGIGGDTAMDYGWDDV